MKKICVILFSILLLNTCVCGVNASKIYVVSDNVNVLTTVNNNRNTAANGNNNNNNSNSNGLELSSEHMTCEQLLGKNLVKVLHVVINAIRIGARILGPDKPAVAKVKTLYIRKIVVKLENGIDMQRVRDCLRQVQRQMAEDSRYGAVQVYYDVDPL